MKRLKLTKTTVESLPSPIEGYTIYRDAELRGLGIKVTPNGTKSYFVERKVGGRNVRSVIGRHGEITATEARTKAQAVLAGMSAGIDPILEKRTTVSAKQIKSTTFNDVADSYITSAHAWA
jgi:hypothetical protein